MAKANPRTQRKQKIDPKDVARRLKNASAIRAVALRALRSCAEHAVIRARMNAPILEGCLSSRDPEDPTGFMTHNVRSGAIKMVERGGKISIVIDDSALPKEYGVLHEERFFELGPVSEELFRPEPEGGIGSFFVFRTLKYWRSKYEEYVRDAIRDYILYDQKYPAPFRLTK